MPSVRYSLSRCSCSMCGGGLAPLAVEPLYQASTAWCARNSYTDHMTRHSGDRDGLVISGTTYIAQEGK